MHKVGRMDHHHRKLVEVEDQDEEPATHVIEKRYVHMCYLVIT